MLLNASLLPCRWRSDPMKWSITLSVCRNRSHHSLLFQGPKERKRKEIERHLWLFIHSKEAGRSVNKPCCISVAAACQLLYCKCGLLYLHSCLLFNRYFFVKCLSKCDIKFNHQRRQLVLILLSSLQMLAPNNMLNPTGNKNLYGFNKDAGASMLLLFMLCA